MGLSGSGKSNSSVVRLICGGIVRRTGSHSADAQNTVNGCIGQSYAGADVSGAYSGVGPSFDLDIALFAGCLFLRIYECCRFDERSQGCAPVFSWRFCFRFWPVLSSAPALWLCFLPVGYSCSPLASAFLVLGTSISGAHVRLKPIVVHCGQAISLVLWAIRLTAQGPVGSALSNPTRSLLLVLHHHTR